MEKYPSCCLVIFWNFFHCLQGKDGLAFPICGWTFKMSFLLCLNIPSVFPFWAWTSQLFFLYVPGNHSCLSLFVPEHFSCLSYLRLIITTPFLNLCLEITAVFLFLCLNISAVFLSFHFLLFHQKCTAGCRGLWWRSFRSRIRK